MDFRLLGPLEVRRSDEQLALGGPRQRALLATLVLRANRFVSPKELARAIWEQPPNSAGSNLRTHVSAVRRLLGDTGRLAGGQQGYRLTVAAGESDLMVFDDLVRHAGVAHEQGEFRRAADLYGRALALWRGAPLAGEMVGPLLRAEIKRLEQRRQDVVEQSLDSRIRSGQHRELIDELRELVLELPYREGLRHQLMLALYRSGRRAEALEAYQDTRRVLAGQLGIEPGPSLQALQAQILASKPVDPPAVALGSIRPAELPNAIADFTGRDAELEHLDQLAESVQDCAVVLAVSGTAGVGKSALAVRWAHQVAGRFPDGQLFVNLRGYAGQAPITPSDALDRLLRSLGQPAEQIPAHLDARAATYRSLLVGKRVLVVLDDARTTEQVRQLLPGQPGCLVIVTSRDRLVDLAALDGARPVTLDVLKPPDSLSLIARMLADDRVANEPEAAAALVGLCAHLPLALRLTAAHLATRPQQSVEAEVSRLRRTNQRLPADVLAAVRAAFERSYLALDEQTRRGFRLLGRIPGPDFTAQSAAAMLNWSLRTAEDQLDRLFLASLIDQPAVGRYRFHDLLRRYAVERSTAEDGSVAGQVALVRLFRWYLHSADAATRVIDPCRRRPPLSEPDHPARPPVHFDDVDSALAWCEAERLNLVAAVRSAAGQGLDDLTWQLPVALFGFFEVRKYWPDWIETHELGLASARRLEERSTEAWMLNSLGIAHKQSRQFERALGCYRQALRIRVESGDRHGQAVTLNNLGTTANQLRRHQEAIGHYERALAIFRLMGDDWGEGLALTNLGEVHRKLGRYDLALDHYQQASQIRESIGDLRGHGIIMHNLGETYRELGRFDQAGEYYRKALEIRTAAGDRWGAARTLAALGHIFDEYADGAAAADCWQRAAQIFDELGDAEAADLRILLKRSGGFSSVD